MRGSRSRHNNAEEIMFHYANKTPSMIFAMLWLSCFTAKTWLISLLNEVQQCRSYLAKFYVLRSNVLVPAYIVKLLLIESMKVN